MKEQLLNSRNSVAKISHPNNPRLQSNSISQLYLAKGTFHLTYSGMMGFFGTALLLSLACFQAQGQVSKLVIGGRDAEPGEAPYQLGIWSSDYGFPCGASLVMVDNVQFAITAAHCVVWTEPSSIDVAAGDWDITDNDGTEQWRQVSRIAVHPDFNPKYPVNDIAVLFWDEPFQINTNVSTIDLPTSETNGPPSTVVVTGWGRRSYEIPISDVLQLAKIPVVNDDICQEAWHGLIPESVICAGAPQIGPCFGDDGGPAKDFDQNTLVGVVSFGYGCGNPDLPVIFTEVAYYVDWINQEVATYKEVANKA